MAGRLPSKRCKTASIMDEQEGEKPGEDLGARTAVMHCPEPRSDREKWWMQLTPLLLLQPDLATAIVVKTLQRLLRIGQGEAFVKCNGCSAPGRPTSPRNQRINGRN